MWAVSRSKGQKPCDVRGAIWSQGCIYFLSKWGAVFFLWTPESSKSQGVCQWKSRGMDFLEEVRVSSVVFFGCFLGVYLLYLCHVVCGCICDFMHVYCDTHISMYLWIFVSVEYDSFQHAYQFMVVRFFCECLNLIIIDPLRFASKLFVCSFPLLLSEQWQIYLAGGFKHLLCSSLFWGRFPFWLIFFKWVETTN